MSSSPDSTPQPSTAAGSSPDAAGTSSGAAGTSLDAASTSSGAAGTSSGSEGIPPDLRAAGVFVVDLIAVVVFVLLGRTSHGESEALRGVLVTLWPFLSGMLVGWAVLLLTGLRVAGYRAGVVLVVATVGVGMVLRHTVSHDGTPPSFVVAASTFLALFYLGWRAVARFAARRRRG